MSLGLQGCTHNFNKYIASILKAYVKDKNINAKNSSTFPNFNRYIYIANGETMVSFYVSFPKTNI